MNDTLSHIDVGTFLQTTEDESKFGFNRIDAMSSTEYSLLLFAEILS
jgi:hypothetical protein